MLINDHDRTNSSIEIYGNILINHDIFNEMITRYKKTKLYCYSKMRFINK